jgi:hypothetical protein
MVNLYAWNARAIHGSPGHAALEVLSRARIYISWWPIDFSFGKPTVPLGGFVQSSPHLNLNEDIEYEKRQPDHRLGVYGLNETAILDFWRVWNQHNRYRLYNQSCATTVADALTAGGGNKYAPQYSKRRISWTPAAVYEYALAINHAPKDASALMVHRA